MRKCRIFQKMAMVMLAMSATTDLAIAQDVNGEEGTNVIEELMKDEQGRLTVFAAQLGAFRELAMKKPQDAVASFFDEKAKGKWNSQIAPDMIDQQLTDYFTGAIALSGPQDAKSSILALYNPWWDTVMLLRMGYSVGGVVPEMRITDYYLLSGETFRGEAVCDSAGDPKVLTVVPEKDPLSVEIWRVVAATRRRFVEVFPLDGKVSWGKMSTTLIGLNPKAELSRIQTRSAVRLRLTLSFLKNARDVGIATHITKLIRSGNELQLMTYFREANSRPLTRMFAQVPEMFRKDFTPYGYVPTEKATLYVFVNKKVPRLYVTVSLMKKVEAKTSSMEWYDLLQADQLLSAWNNRKEASK